MLSPFRKDSFFSDELRWANNRSLTVYVQFYATGTAVYSVDKPTGIDVPDSIVIRFPHTSSVRRSSEHFLEARINDSALKGFIGIYDNRAYLRNIQHPSFPLREEFSEVPWLNDPHRTAILDFRGEAHNWLCTMFFHKDFRTLSEKAKISVFKIMGKKGQINGSAFSFVREDGSSGFLTARHCVENVDRVRLETSDGVSFEARVSSKYANCDLAELTPAADHPVKFGFLIGDSKICEVDDVAYVIGYPSTLGNDPTTSAGRISKINAEYKSESGLIQISGASVNPANSGGPVTNFRGDVIGVLTARGLSSEKIQNVSFCEPVERLMQPI